MTSKQRARLRTIVAEMVSELRAQGQITTRALVEAIKDRHPDLVEDAKDALIYEALSGWARKALKSEREDLKSPQFVLPIELQGLKLPAAISVPDESDDPDAPLWMPIEDATFDQLEKNLAMLQGSVAADMRRLQNVRQLHRYLAPFMADERRCEPIGKVLAECAEGANYGLLRGA